MTNSTKIIVALVSIFIGVKSFGQTTQPYTASFIGRMGVDTVLVETYTMINNHLYGKAFIRVPEDYIGEFSIHFYPDGSIREFDVSAMDPSNSSLPFAAKSGAFEYRLNMNCKNDTCTYYNSIAGVPTEKIYIHPASRVDFVGGWVPFISLMEWHCRRLVQSEKQVLPLKMINHNIGVYDIGVHFLNRDTIIFGGPFLEYTKIGIDKTGKVLGVDGIGTPWNYYVTSHPPINVDMVAKRMAKTPGIGIPSPTETTEFEIQGSKIGLTYGRPYKRGRTIFGGVVPYDTLWRTGANGPTVLTFQHDIKLGDTTIPKGKYSIYTIPKRNEWSLIFSADLKSWPTDPDRSKEFAQVVIPVEKTKNISEQFTIEIIEVGKKGEMKFSWDDKTAVAKFEVLKE
jgi:Protein of unknown function (DUF2911)